MVMQEIVWISIDDVDVAEYDRTNIFDACQEIGTPFFHDDIVPILSEEIENWRLRITL